MERLHCELFVLVNNSCNPPVDLFAITPGEYLNFAVPTLGKPLHLHYTRMVYCICLIITEYLQYTQTEANDQTEWIKTGIEYKKQTDIQ